MGAFCWLPRNQSAQVPVDIPYTPPPSSMTCRKELLHFLHVLQQGLKVIWIFFWGDLDFRKKRSECHHTHDCYMHFQFLGQSLSSHLVLTSFRLRFGAPETRPCCTRKSLRCFGRVWNAGNSRGFDLDPSKLLSPKWNKHRSPITICKWDSSWRFQPICKILVKMGIFPN